MEKKVADETFRNRVVVLMTDSDKAALDDWRAANRIFNMSEAVRVLIARGMNGSDSIDQAPDQAATSASPVSPAPIATPSPIPTYQPSPDKHHFCWSVYPAINTLTEQGKRTITREELTPMLPEQVQASPGLNASLNIIFKDLGWKGVGTTQRRWIAPGS